MKNGERLPDDLMQPIDGEMQTNDLVKHCLLRLRELEKREAESGPVGEALDGLEARRDLAHARLKALRTHHATKQVEGSDRSKRKGAKEDKKMTKAEKEVRFVISCT